MKTLKCNHNNYRMRHEKPKNDTNHSICSVLTGTCMSKTKGGERERPWRVQEERFLEHRDC